jgi:hypothetical protein
MVLETTLYYVPPEHWEAFQAKHVTIHHREDGEFFHVVNGHAHGRFTTPEQADEWGKKQIPELRATYEARWTPNEVSGLKPFPSVPASSAIEEKAEIVASAYLGLRDALALYVAEEVEKLCNDSPELDFCTIDREESTDVVQLTYCVAGHELLHVTITPVKGT